MACITSKVDAIGLSATGKLATCSALGRAPDLFLVHWPGAWVYGGGPPDIGGQRARRLRAESWRVLEDLHIAGEAKAIGVCNYTAAHLEELLLNCRVKPHVMQSELHVHFQQRELRALCAKHGIVFQAYAPLGGDSARHV